MATCVKRAAQTFQLKFLKPRKTSTCTLTEIQQLKTKYILTLYNLINHRLQISWQILQIQFCSKYVFFTILGLCSVQLTQQVQIRIR